MSVPDSDLLIALSKALETPVSTLLGETVAESKADSIKVICEKLERINLQFAQEKERRRKALHWLLLLLGTLIAAGMVFLMVANSPYLGWDYRDPELAVAGVAFHAFEWFFVRLAPVLFILSMIGVWLTRKK